MHLSEYLKKIFAQHKSKARQSGQALLEYILVLIIAVSILMGVLYQFNDAFKQYLDSFFGDYIACLLETGELPQLGGNGPGSGECVMPKLDIASGDIKDTSATGEAASSGEGKGGGGGSGGGTSEGDSQDPSDSNRANNRPAQFTSNGGTSNGDTAGGANARAGRPASQIKSASDLNGASSDSKKSQASSGEGGFGNGAGGIIRRRRVVYVDDKYVSKEAKKKKERPSVTRVTAAKSTGVGRTLRKPSFDLDLPETKVKDVEAKTGGLGFGSIIKYMLIFGILIAILVFLGGQAMQIKKGWQKSE